MSKLRVWLELGRVSNLPTVWSNTFTGLILAGGELAPTRLGLLGAAMSLFYVGGMFLNDAFDRGYDVKARPGRPIPSGRVSAGEVFGIGFGMLAAGVAVLAFEAWGAGGRGSALPVLSGVALAGAVVLYDAWHKNNPLSPLLMGACRVLIYLTVALAVADRPSDATLWGMAMLLAYLIGLTFVAKQEDLQKLGNLWPLLFLLAPLGYGASVVLESRLAAGMWAALALWVANCVKRVKRREIGAAVVQLIAGISLLDGLLIVRSHGPVLAVTAAAGCFVLTLFFQRFIKGT